MDEMVSVCGLLCSECGAFIATKNDDDKKRAEVARLWSKQYSVKLKPKDINCSGCISDVESLFGHCKVCEIRKCGREKGVVNCAYCDEYPCDKLAKLFQMAPDAMQQFDKIKSRL